MDAVQPAAAQHGKDGRSVVCAASDPGWTTEGGLGLSSACPVCSKFEYSSWLTPVDEQAHHANCFLLCCCSATDSCNSWTVSQPVVQSLIVSLAKLYNSATLAGLPAWQQDALQTSVCPERYGASDTQIQEIRSRDATVARPSMVANPRKNLVSAVGNSDPLSELTCSTAPCWWPSPIGGGRVTAKTSFGVECDLRSAIAPSLLQPIGQPIAFHCQTVHLICIKSPL